MTSLSNLASSSSQITYFHYIHQDKKFARTALDSPLLQNSSHEINQVLTLLEVILSQTTTSKEIRNSIIWRIFISIVPFLLILDYMRRSPVAFLLFFLYVIGSIWFIFTERSVKAKEVKDKSQKIIQKFSNIFQQKGFYWNIPVAFPQYIELHNGHSEKYIVNSVCSPQSNVQLTVMSAEKNLNKPSVYQPLVE